jgi:Rod binding domain-containing protein
MRIETQMNPAGPAAGRNPDPAVREDALRAVARDLEAAFIAEMLKQSGLGAASAGFGGGPGEAQFASFLRAEHAKLFAESGGIGLAESIFRSLTTRGAGT